MAMSSIPRHARLERLPIADSVAPSAHALDQPLPAERAQRTRNDFAHRPELLSERVLGHAERNRRRAGELRPAEQKLDEPRVDGARGALVQPLDEESHARRKSTRDEKRDRRMFGDRRLERLTGEQGTACGRSGDRGRGMRTALDQGDLGQCAAGRLGVHDVLPRAGSAHDADESVEHDEPSSRQTAREEDHLVRGKTNLDSATRERVDDFRRNAGEQRKLRQLL